MLFTLAVILVGILWGGVFLFASKLPSNTTALPTLMLLPTGTPSERAQALQPAAQVAISSAVMPASSAQSDVLPAASVASTPVPTLPPLSPSVQAAVSLPVDTFSIPPAAVAGQVLVHFAPGSSAAERAAYVAGLGGTVVQEIAALDTVVVQVADTTTFAALPDVPVVVASEPDYYVAALDSPAPNDPLFDQQWALTAMSAPAAWAALPGDAASVTVAVIDSGICANHPDLAGRILPGHDFVEGDSSPEDALGHGCAIAGIIAANANDGIGMAGLAQHAQIMPLRVLDASGVGTYSNVAAAVVYAADQGAQVINLSLGGVNRSDTLEAALDYAIAKGVTVIAAAGNQGTDTVLYPAAYAPVVAVGAVDQTLQRAAYSSFGSAVDVYAPGSAVTVTALDGGWTLQSGTSFAAAYASGVAALRIAQNADLALDGGVVSALPGAGITVVEAPQPTLPPVVAVPLPAEYESILARIQEAGSARVIVGLAGDFRPEFDLSPQGVDQQRVTIQAAQTDLATALQAYDVQAVTRFQTIPFLSVVVDEAALRFLAQSAQASSIQLERVYRPDLAQSTGIIGADVAWGLGYTGAGYAVAIIDTGVDNAHPFLSGKVIDGACFSHTGSDTNGTYTSLCPNGQGSQTGAGAAAACSGYSACEHGTHVAGIVAGEGASFDGVAPGASLLPVQVYTLVSSIPICGSTTPCVVAFDTEIMLGLEWVYNQRSTYPIASTNMSLGTADHIPTDCSSMHPALAALITQLQAANIATVAASGNYGGNTGVAFPACIAPMVNVAATDKSDVVASFSQLGANLDFGAPGLNITSSVPGGGFGIKNGTSMAAPHVAAAWAILRQAQPSATVQQIYDALANTSVVLTRSSDGGTVRRINIGSAASALAPGGSPTNTPLPPTATPIPPTNTPLPPTATPVPPTNTPLPPTNTPLPPTATPIPPTNTPLPPTATTIPPTNTPAPTTTTFYRAINLGGAAVVIDGNNWEGKTAANHTTNGMAL
ncbi:MAG: S8 family serine peptidase, partial [Anaerolineae bacterium]|nr:S8 family serine peptidase [Anaerolineae bacterium]